MATPAENLLTEYAAIAADLATSPAPDTPVNRRSDAGGTRKGEIDNHRLRQLQRMKLIREELAAMGVTIGADGTITDNRAFELESYGY